jgi:hypothetical protein
MIYVEVVQNSGGRTGHKMKDFITGIIINKLCGYKMLINKSWKFPKNNCNNHCGMFNLLDPDLIADTPINDVINLDYKMATWVGMKYHLFDKILKNVKKVYIENPSSNIILRLFGSTRIQLSDVYNWEKDSKIAIGSYNNIISYLRNRYYMLHGQLTEKNKKNIRISIHIRKGDVFHRELHKSVKYYEDVIKKLKKINCIKDITIYSEKWEGYDEKDVRDLIKYKDDKTNIKIVLDRCLYEYFHEILSSDIYVATIGQGGFSDLLMTYLDDNKPVIYKDRQLIFCDNMAGKFFYVDASGNFDIETIINKVCKK